jgi:hypothetical protein
MQLSEYLDKLYDIYDREGDIDVYEYDDAGNREPEIELIRSGLKKWLLV